MVEGEVVVLGPEADRVTAFFDSNSRLQIFGGGSLSEHHYLLSVILRLAAIVQRLKCLA